MCVIGLQRWQSAHQVAVYIDIAETRPQVGQKFLARIHGAG